HADAPLVRHRLLYINTPGERPMTDPRNCWVEVDGAVSATLEGREWWPPGIDGLVTLITPERAREPLVSDKLYDLVSTIERLERIGNDCPSIAVCGAS